MAADSFTPKFDFGVISSGTVADSQLNDDVLKFFDAEEGEEVRTIAQPVREQKGGDKKPTEEGKDKLPNNVIVADNQPTPMITDEELLGDDNEEEILKEEEEEQKKNIESEDEEKQEVTGGSLYSDIAEELYNMDIFTEDEDGRVSPTTPEEFRDLFLLEKKRGVAQILDEFLGSKGEETRQAFQDLYINGVDPRSYIQKIVGIKDVESLDITQESNQERVVRELYRRNGMKNIDARIEKLKQYGDLEPEAVDAKETLIEQDKASLESERVAAQQKEQRKGQIRQEYLQNVSRILNDKLTKKEFDGIPVTRQFAQEVGEYLTRPVAKIDGEEINGFDNELRNLNKPENHEKKIKVAMLLKLLQTDPTLKSIQKAGVSKESNELFQKVAQRVQKTTNTSTKKETKPASWFPK